jgi:hypothetical protein
MSRQNGFLDQECGLPNGGFGDQKQLKKVSLEEELPLPFHRHSGRVQRIGSRGCHAAKAQKKATRERVAFVSGARSLS